MGKQIYPATRAEVDALDDHVEKYNEALKPVLQDKKYESFAYVMKEADGQVIAGCSGYSSLYFIGYIDTLWVAENYRGHGLGSQLLAKVEADLKAYGCELCHLDTFDFQAPHFYEQHGYKVFGQLEHKKAGIKEFFLCKEL